MNLLYLTNNMDFKSFLNSTNCYNFTSPLSVPVGKKRFTLNLNKYRNSHFSTLNTAKKNYALLMNNQMNNKIKFNKIAIVYTYFHGDNGTVDTANVASIHAKFFCDCLVKYKYIEDDDRHHICFSAEQFGGVDKLIPRMEISVYPLADNFISVQL